MPKQYTPLGQYLSNQEITQHLKRGVQSLQESKEKQLTRNHIISEIQTQFPNTNLALRLISNAGSGAGAFKLEEQLAAIYPKMTFASIEYKESAILATQPRLKALNKTYKDRFSITHANNSDLASESTQEHLKLARGADIIWNDGMCTFNTNVEKALIAIIDAHNKYHCFDHCWKRGSLPQIFLTVALKDQCRARRLNKVAAQLVKKAGLYRGQLTPDADVTNLATGIWLYMNKLASGNNIKFLPTFTILYRSTPKLLGTPMLLVGLQAVPSEFQSSDYTAAIPEVKNFIYNQQVEVLKVAVRKANLRKHLQSQFSSQRKYANAIGLDIISQIQVPTDELGKIIPNTDYRKSVKVHKALFITQQSKKHRPIDGGIPIKEFVKTL